MKNRNQTIQEFQKIPGVGIKIADDLWNIGVRSVDDLVTADPSKLYKKLCDHQGQHIDRCMLYVFRCAVYFAKVKNPDPELLKWWNWSDQSLKKREPK